MRIVDAVDGTRIVRHALPDRAAPR
jgi:hypothetical protein